MIASTIIPKYCQSRPTYIETISGNHTSWFDTGITAIPGMKIVMTMNADTTTPTWDNQLISLNSTDEGWGNGFTNGTHSTDRGLMICGNSTYALISQPTTAKFHKILTINSDSTLSMDGLTTSGPALLGKIRVFGNSNADRNAYATLYSLQIYQGTTLISNMRPCIDKYTGKKCVYDEVRDILLYSGTSTDFIGANQTFVQYSYLEKVTTGPWFDTLWTGDLKRLVVDMNAQNTVTTSAYSFLAGYDSGGQIGTMDTSMTWAAESSATSSISALNKTNLHMYWDSSNYYHAIINGTYNMNRPAGGALTTSLSYGYPLFTAKNASGSLYSECRGGRIWDVKMRYDNILVRDLMPIWSINDNQYCMYDWIYGKYYYRQGTGSFTGGND